MNSEIKQCYEILQISPRANRDEIRRAYRRLALKYHPDKNPGREAIAGRHFMTITRAYTVLMNYHDSQPVNTPADAVEFFKRQFFSLVQRIHDNSPQYASLDQEECDFFFRYQIEEVRMVQRGRVEARRILNLMRKAMSKGYDPSELLKEHRDFFRKHGFFHLDDPEGTQTQREMKELLWENPTSAESHYQLGILYERRNRIQEALREYRIASYLDPRRQDVKRAIRRLESLQRTGD